MKTIKSKDLGFTRGTLLPIRNDVSSSEAISGRTPQYPVNGVIGCRVTLEATLERHGPDRFQLRYRDGERWKLIETIAPDDPRILELEKAGAFSQVE